MTRPDLAALAALLDKAEPKPWEFGGATWRALSELLAYMRELEQQVQACSIRPRGKSIAPEAIATALAMRERCAQACEKVRDKSSGTATECIAAIRALEL